MSIPEAPFDGEAHARKEGAWVLAYGRTALDSFVELCRSFFSGCEYYYNEVKRMYDEIMGRGFVEDVPDDKLYARRRDSWEAIGNIGTKVRRVVDDTPTQITDETHVLLYYQATGNGNIRIVLPAPTANKVINFVVTFAPSIADDTVLAQSIGISVNGGSNIVAADGTSTMVYLRTPITYIAAVVDGSWHMPDAVMTIE